MIATEQDIHLEQMKLEALRAEDELKSQQRMNAIQWTMADVPTRPASRELPSIEQAFNCPPPESVSKWGEEIEVRFEDISGTQGSHSTGYVHARREGTRWDKAASDAFGIPMQITDPRMEIGRGDDILLKCKPIFGLDEMTAPVSAPNRRQYQPGKSFPVRIKLQLKDRMVPLEVLNSSPAGYVEFQARIHCRTAVEFFIPKPTTWTPGIMCQIRRVKTQQPQGPTGQTASLNGEVKIKMTMKYSIVRVSIPNIVVPRTEAARDIITAWWEAVERSQIKDSNIACLSKDPDAYDIQDEDGGQVDLEEGMEIFLTPLNRTSPEVVTIDVTWDGFYSKGLPLRLSISPSVHREAPRARLLALWIEHYKNHRDHAEVASHLFTDENEYYWKDHTGTETAPPWTPGQQVVFKMKPWSKENAANRQQKRPRPPPSDGQDPLGPFSGQPQTAPPATSTGSGIAETDQTNQPVEGATDQMGQYISLKRSCPTRQLTIRVMIEEQAIELKVDPKIVIQTLVHKVAQAISRDLPGW
jgi:hypothetical protein